MMLGAFSHRQDIGPPSVMLANDARCPCGTSLEIADGEGAEVPSPDRHDDVFPNDCIIRHCRNERNPNSIHIAHSPRSRTTERGDNGGTVNFGKPNKELVPKQPRLFSTNGGV